jgi:HK97 family phage major capsid protein
MINMGTTWIIVAVMGLWINFLTIPNASSCGLSAFPNGPTPHSCIVSTANYLHHHGRRHYNESEINMSHDVMTEIKRGVEGIVTEQKELRARLDEFDIVLSKLASDTRKRGWVSGGTADPVGFLLKMAAAQIYLKDGCGDSSFERAGLSAPEKKLIQACTRKAMDTGTSGAGGGFTVPPDYVAAYIQVLRAKSTVLKTGATLMEGLTGSPVQIPKQLTSTSASWVGQNATISATDPSFGQVQMTPKLWRSGHSIQTCSGCWRAQVWK